MLSVVYAEDCNQANLDYCRYGECHYSECCGAQTYCWLRL
jgi:hypothetical protein